MSQSLQQIENFFQGLLSESERQAFEQSVIQDPEFAKEVAWYITGTSAIKSENLALRKEALRQIWEEHKANVTDRIATKTTPVFRLWKYVAAAAAVLLLVLATWIFSSGSSQQQLAATYIENELTDLGAKMSATTDTIEKARQLINEKSYDVAVRLLNEILVSNPENVKALEYAGIATLHQDDYTNALLYFRRLSETTGIYSNPGSFYIALTLMKRNQPGDATQAKEILETVVKNKTGNFETAAEWLEDW